ncbi:MAG: sigma-70 family RNA polymerase sigma factor [Deltaproteobacteria bacterium]|nr:sigma-70 family RNA polymerase sigma factor [Deltaproteobacteria bacterium]
MPSPSSPPRYLQLLDGGADAAVEAPPAVLTIDDVFRAHAPFVARVALRVLGRTNEVDDLVQEVFLRVYDRLGDVREPAAIRGWLAVITARLARRRLRSRRMQIWLGVAAGYDYAQLADGAMSPEDRAFVAELYRALDRLPVRERLAWTLRNIEGLELEVVAHACGCSLATVKRRIAAAEARLRKEVDHA